MQKTRTGVWHLKLSIFLVIFIVLAIQASASWQTYQNDLRNTGSSDGTGYFPLETNNLSIGDLGMDFHQNYSRIINNLI